VAAAQAAARIVGDTAGNCDAYCQAYVSCPEFVAATLTGSGSWTCITQTSDPEATMPVVADPLADLSADAPQANTSSSTLGGGGDYQWNFDETADYGYLDRAGKRRPVGAVKLRAHINLTGAQSTGTSEMRWLWGPAIRQGLAFTCFYKKDNRTCESPVSVEYPSFNTGRYPESITYYHT